MVSPPQFNNLQDLNESSWLHKVKTDFNNNVWPIECQRCQKTENETGTSIRIHSNLKHQETAIDNYLQVGGVLDNLCNAGCLTCNPNCSTKIGSLSGRVFPIINNSDKFWSLPQDKIIHLDINGGEPSYSKNYKKLLGNLPTNLKTLRLNTNCNTVFSDLVEIANKGIDVTVTVSFDGVGSVFELVRWPIKWNNFYKNLMAYKAMPIKLNLWTTVSVLNVDDLPNIISFAQEHQIDHSYAYLSEPVELNVENKNLEQIQTYIQKQKKLRGIT